MNLSRSKRFMAVAMLCAMIAIVLAGLIFHVAPIFIGVALLVVILAMFHVARKASPPRTESGRYWLFLQGSLLFFLGDLYGFWDSTRHGWKWTDLLSLIVPTAMGIYFLRCAAQSRRRSSIEGPPENGDA